MDTGQSTIVLKELLTGRTLQDVGDDFGVSRQRISQILTQTDQAILKAYRQCKKDERKRKSLEEQARRKALRWTQKSAERFLFVKYSYGISKYPF